VSVRRAACVLALALALTAMGCGSRGDLPPYRPPAVRREVSAVEDEVRLAVMGDWGARSRAQADVIAAIDRTAAEVGGLHGGLLLGDNVYSRGVSSPDDDLLRIVFEEPFDTPWLARVPWVAVLGNHDYEGDPEAQIAYSARSRGRWVMPAHHFRHDWAGADGDVLLTVLALDTNRQYGAWAEQVAWLEAELERLAGAPWPVVAIGHHPIASHARVPLRVEEQVDLLVATLFRLKPAVDLYCAGHSHCLELIEGHGPAQAILGAGGKELYPVDEGPGTRFAASTFGFGLLRAGRGTLTLEFRDASTRVLYTWRAP
jgi:acid phosphatase